MWKKILILGMVLYGLGAVYFWLYLEEINTTLFSENLAFTGGLLIGLSFALSGITFFYNFFDSKLKYRKHIGLLGYYLALAYTVTLALRFPEKYIWGLPSRLLHPEVLLGLGAMAILSFMAVISQNWAAQKLGKNWRPLLRLGYLAYMLLIARAVIVEGTAWQLWAAQMDKLPPPRLLLTMYACFVVLLRIVLEVAIRLHIKPKPATVKISPHPSTNVIGTPDPPAPVQPIQSPTVDLTTPKVE